MQVKNGFGQFEMGPRKFVHLFDAYAKLSKWEFGEDGVLFSTRFIGTNFYQDSIKEKTVSPYLLFHSVKPAFDETEILLSLINGIDNTNINIARVANDTEFIAMSDFWRHYKLDMATLSKTRQVNPEVPGVDIDTSSLFPTPSTAHPLPEYGSPYHITYVTTYNPLGKFVLTVCRIITSEIREYIASIELDRFPYMHSFGLSQNYAIIFMAPLFINLEKMLKTGIPVESLEWVDGEPTRVFIVELKTGKIRTLETAAIFGMHHINAYEDKFGRIVFDVITYPDIEFVRELRMNVLLDPKKRDTVSNNADIKRYIVDLRDTSISKQPLPSTPGKEFANRMDMPSINEHFRYRKYCYTYGLVQKSDNTYISDVSLVKKDLCRNGRDRAWSVPNQYASEPLFVPDPTGKAEDDGVVLSVILDGVMERSFLGIFDARTMKLINRSYLPIPVPFSMHGKFFFNP